MTICEASASPVLQCGEDSADGAAVLLTRALDSIKLRMVYGNIYIGELSMPETWKPITGFEALYEVSDLGRVRSLDREVGHRWGGKAVKRGKILKPRADKNGYLFISLCSDGVSVNAKLHRLVAQHFLPASDLQEVNHRDFDKSNNARTNLEWTTRGGNQAHASSGGLFSGRTNQRRAKKLTTETARAIRSARQAGATFKSIAEQFGISAPTAWKVVHGEIWACSRQTGLNEREWECGGCSAVHDRDVNAALNIARLGQQSLTEGASA